MLEERAGKLEFHPLAAAFLEEQARRGTTSNIEDTVVRCLAAYRARREWDAAFELVDRFGTDQDFEALFSDALEELLNAARLATVETWILRAQARHVASSTIEMAKAELALRDGQNLSAQTFAQAALAMAETGSNDAWRAAMVAGRAAHSGSREESALGFYRAAEGLARDERQSRDALWGQLMAASALELDEAQELVALLEATSSRSDRYELVRMADKKLGVDLRFGTMRSLSNARRVAELVGHINDPFARCSFRSFFAYALVLSALYREAYEQAVLFFEDAREFRVDPALPYAHFMLGNSLAGLGRYADAHLALDEAVRESRRCNDEFGIQNVFASRMRILVQEGRAAEACSLETPDLEHSVRAMRGEVLSSRGLALATIGRFADAQALGTEAANVTKGIEARLLVPAIHALCSLKQRTSGTREAVELLLLTAMDSGAVDLVVSAYRGNPDLLEAMLLAPGTREHTVHIVRRAGDENCWRRLGSSPQLSRTRLKHSLVENERSTTCSVRG